MQKTISQMTKEEREKSAMALGTMILMLEERHSVTKIGKEINLEPWKVDWNIDELLYILRKYAGKWRFFKILFMK